MAAASEPVWASTVLFRTDAQLVSLSERVVHGRVTAQRTTRAGVRGRIYTVTTLRVIEDLTGLDGDTVEIWELGGRIGDEHLYVGGGVQFTPGQEVVVFLERGPFGLRTVAMGFSKFDVMPEVGGERSLRRDMRGTQVVGGLVARDPYLSELRTLATQITGRPARQGLQPAASIETPIQQAFTLLGPFRWVQADSATPVTWYVNTSAASPLTSGNIATEMQLALSAWTNPPTASIVLQYGGTTFQADADGPFTGVASAAGVVTFEDPNNEINGSVLAIGGGWAGGNGGTVNGQSFSAFTRGYVIFQNAANLGASFRTPPNFTRVLVHEIGHAIGLGHSNSDTSNIMYPSCCAGNTPISPAIGADDLAGLNFIYPQSGAPSCSYSINPTSASVGAGVGSGSVSVTTQSGCSWVATSNSGFLGVSSGASGSGSGTVGYSVSANATASSRSGSISISGQTFTVNQAAGCVYTLSATSASTPSGGGGASVNVTAGTGCSWTATSNAGFVSILSGSSGTGSGSVTYNVNSNGVSFRSGTMTVAGQTFTVNQFGTGPMVSIDRSSLRYGATLSGTQVTAQTSAQTIRLTQTAGSPINWTASSNQSWLQVSPASGSGGRDISISVNPTGLNASTTVTGTISLSTPGAGNAVSPIAVTLVTMPTGISVTAVGVIDTPLNNATGVTGAIPVTGWALDDVDVANVFVCRAPVSGEGAPPDGRCGASQIYVGEAVFIEDARPDVQAAYPTLPRNYRGGWGFMVLTNMLPNQGNGQYTLFAHALDREGRLFMLGWRTITCSNASATLPFGTIDTPGQGETISGAAYTNFGWAVTQSPKVIPFNGSTITVFVDGVAVGSPSYNHYRSDIATLFPGLQNSNGAVGVRTIDTTALSNGLHTISWSVTDSASATAGIGSRFFRVSNGTSSSVVSTVEAVAEQAALGAVTETSPILGRRGWDPSAPLRAYPVGASGRAVVRGEEMDRFELWLGAESSHLTGHLKIGASLAPLPIGSRLDGSTGVFTWSPGLGFIGSYDLVFYRWSGDRVTSQYQVRVILRPKSQGFVGVQVEIDSPRSQQDVAQPFVVEGWAADLDAEKGTGIDTLHVWAYPLAGGPPVFLGVPVSGRARPDVGAVHGDEFTSSGFRFDVQGLPHGNYDLAVFPWSSVSGGFAPPKVVRVTVR